MGLTVSRTAHQMTVNGRRLWTWCAYDTLFLPTLLGETGEIETRDPETERVIRLTVSPTGIEAAEPAGAIDRKSVVEGKSVSVRVEIGGLRIFQKTKNTKQNNKTNKT